MPKLETTVDNLEWKSNKIISTSTIAPDAWTDTQYLSAKALLNVTHPIGSILTTATRVNPSTTIGGTWELVDKAFKNAYINLDDSYWTSTNSSLVLTTEQGDSSACIATLVDHTVHIRLKLKPIVSLTDSDTTLGTINLSKIGLNNLLYTVFSKVAMSDGGQCTISYSVNNAGTVITHDVLNVNGTHTMAADQFFYVDICETVTSSMMMDDFCNKFYWKRIS